MTEAVDVVLGVGDGRVRTVPGEADLERGEGVAVDEKGGHVRAADAGVPETAAGLEGLDVVTLVETHHVADPHCQGTGDHESVTSRVKPLTCLDFFLAFFCARRVRRRASGFPRAQRRG